MPMLDDAKPKTRRAGSLIPFLIILLSLIGGLAVVCQTGEHTWSCGHDVYRLLPIKSWRIGSGTWEGNPGGKFGCGCYYDYGFVERYMGAR